MTTREKPRSIDERVVEAVAAERGLEPTDIDPLYHTIDPDCLNDMFRNVPENADRRSFHVTFRVAGCQVVVSHDGSVDVSAAAEDVASQPPQGEPNASHAAESPD